MMTRLAFRQLAIAMALLAALPALTVKAQQAAGPEKVANTAAGPAKANPAASTAAGLRIDPITGAPTSSPARGASVAADAAGAQKAPAASDGSVHQGLTVHGHWVINVRNADGSLAQHREFENSLQLTGQGALVGLLSGYLVPGDWMIVLGPQSGNGACNLTYEFCGLIHNAATYPAQGYCSVYYCTGSTLSYTYNFGSGGLGGPFSIVLNGSIIANQTGTIGTVTTLLNTCANIAFSNSANPSSVETTSPSTCVTQTNPTPWYGPFTSANITAIPVTSGQSVQAIVTITFS
jgi:hypothetical protein